MKLSSKEIESFNEEGWIGNYKLLDSQQVSCITRSYLSIKDKFLYPVDIVKMNKRELHSIDRLPWFKSLHAYIPVLFELVSNEIIVEKIKSILGENVIAWGCSVIERKPEQVHRWHIDVEHKTWNGVSVFVGLNGITLDSSLTIVTKSHNFASIPQSMHFDSDSAFRDYCFCENSESKIFNVDLSIGSFFIFHGLLWHSSDNKTYKNRYSILIQYATPDSKIDIPITWDLPVQWANVYPPCILVSGKDNYGNNNYISSPLLSDKP